MDIIFPNDRHQMNWLRPDFPYADVRMPTGSALGAINDLHTAVRTVRVGDEVRTEVVITNHGAKPFFSELGDIGITIPLQDRYDDARVLATQRCNVHLFCDGTSSYILALRMGGTAPHLGLVLTEGDLGAYSVERDTALESNDRGCFVLHPSPFALDAGESTRIAWTIFPCQDKEDFFRQAGSRSRFVNATWTRHVLFAGETSTLRVEASFDAQNVSVDGLAMRREDGAWTADFTGTDPGEHVFVVRVDEQIVRTRILVKVSLSELVERRCAFIATHQQYDGPIERLRGAYLVYDNDEDHVYYNEENDYNAGRERIGMGVLLAEYLRAVSDGDFTVQDPLVPLLVRESLDRYTAFVRRELIDEHTGAAFNDMGRDDRLQRLYNAPWYAAYFLALHRLDGQAEDAHLAFRIIERFYAEGGREFYPIELPVLALVEALTSADLHTERDSVLQQFAAHARWLASSGHDYPESEVNYEQSIVAPAADVILQVHALTGDPDLLDAAQAQLRFLDQFNGVQPDYHLHEVAIRHWDGFWFGKRRAYGDTFPHYWSGSTGNAFALYASATGDADFARRAESSLRGVLPLIFDDGRASCAYLFPLRINGEAGRFFDPFANDQDWGLVFSIRGMRAARAAAASSTEIGR